MIEEVPLTPQHSLDEYSEDFRLSQAIFELKSEARVLIPQLQGRRVFMVNSTAQGGGVAEMLPRVVSMMNELGLETHWLVMGTKLNAFFHLTKRLHNLIHGAGSATLSSEKRTLYEAVSQEVAEELNTILRPDDIVVCHDPQPAGACRRAAERTGSKSIWRCHIGLDSEGPQTHAAWNFLRPELEDYDHFVFSAPEYIPDFVSGNVSIIFPALDPFSHKNRSLSTHKLGGILKNAQLTTTEAPVVTAPYEHPVLRLRPNGEFSPMTDEEDLGLFFRPVVTQISRWDRLKGWFPLISAFAQLKKQVQSGTSTSGGRAQRTLSLCRLVLGGPEPAAVQDDPEAVDVLNELISAYANLDPDIQKDVALLSLPMTSRQENALIVNALQRCSSVVVQNSLHEGFGLTVAEAMWKGIPVLGSNACGIRQQIRHGVDGILHENPESPDSLAAALGPLLTDPGQRALYASRGEKRVAEEFLVFNQVAQWLRVLAQTASAAP